MTTTAAGVNRGRTQNWVARLARAFGGAVGAVLIATLLMSHSSGGPVTRSTIPSASTGPIGTAALALVVGLPSAFALVLALGWHEDRPAWPVAGFILGCVLVSAVFISTKYSTDAGAPLPYFPARTWWACVVMPALGGFAACLVLSRRARR